MTATDATAFLDAIRSNEGDINTHLVFADWLEERGRVNEGHEHRVRAARAACVCGACEDGWVRLQTWDPATDTYHSSGRKKCVACSGTGAAFIDAARTILLAAHDQYAGEVECPADCIPGDTLDANYRPTGGTTYYAGITGAVCKTCRGTGRVPNAAAARVTLIRLAAELENSGVICECNSSSGVRCIPCETVAQRRAEHARLLLRVRADVFAGVDAEGVPDPDEPHQALTRDLATHLPSDWFRHGVGLWEITLPWEVWKKVGRHLYGRELLAGGVTLTTWPEFGIHPSHGSAAISAIHRRLAAEYPGLKFRLTETA
jgi:uncharacterized protein (TIGR02996 family)